MNTGTVNRWNAVPYIPSLRTCGQYSDENGRAIPNDIRYEQNIHFDSRKHPFVLAVMEACTFVCPNSGIKRAYCCGNFRFFARDTSSEPSVFGLCLYRKPFISETGEE